MLDDNYDIVLKNMDSDGTDNRAASCEQGQENGAATSNSEPYQNNEMSKAWVIAEIARVKIANKDITMEQWQAGLLDKHNAMKELAEKYFPNAWSALEFTLSVSKILNIYGCTLPFAGLY